MYIIIDGKIRDNTDLFRAVPKEFSHKYGRTTYEEYYFGGIRIIDTPDGNFHLDINELNGSVPEQIPAEMIIGFSIMHGLSGIQRTLGIYKFGEATAIVDGKKDGMVTVTGTSIEDVRKLYSMIRAGTILPAENWEAEQVKPTFRQRLMFALHQVFLR